MSIRSCWYLATVTVSSSLPRCVRVTRTVHVGLPCTPLLLVLLIHHAYSVLIKRAVDGRLSTAQIEPFYFLDYSSGIVIDRRRR